MLRYDHPNSQMAVKANTVLKVLKNSSDLTLFDILVRESVQNSLDASRMDLNGAVQYFFNIVDYNSQFDLCERLSILKQSGNDPLFSRLTNRIKNSHPSVLVVSDKGTTGLSGPILPSDSTKRRNFGNLVYELGQNHGEEMAGGSFGFGKSIFYRISDVGLVLYYSKTIEDGERLAFCMVSASEQNQTASSTGIAWWGSIEQYKQIKYAVPITESKQISNVLQSLNLSGIRLVGKETGTSICIVSPNLKVLIGEESEKSSLYDLNEKLFERFKEIALKWFWPRMVETDYVSNNTKIRPVVFHVNDKPIDITKEKKYTEKIKLLKATEKLNLNREYENLPGVSIEQINDKSNTIILGALAYKIFDFSISDKSKEINTISMIRAPRMVVYEKEITKNTENFFSAVFLVNSTQEVYRNKKDERTLKKTFLDNAFKDSESSTHSEWNIQNISEDDTYFRNYVRTAVKKCTDIIENAIFPQNGQDTLKSDWAAYSTLLGRILSSDSDGFPTKSFRSKNSLNISSKNKKMPKLILLNREFEVDNKVVFYFKINNASKQLYEICLKVKGGRETLRKSDWEMHVGGEFPFVIDSAKSDAYKITKATDEYVQFIQIDDNMDSDVIIIVVKIIKRDAAIDFELNSYK